MIFVLLDVIPFIISNADNLWHTKALIYVKDAHSAITVIEAKSLILQVAVVQGLPL